MTQVVKSEPKVLDWELEGGDGAPFEGDQLADRVNEFCLEQRLPGYVANMAMKVDSDDEGDVSSDEEIDDTFTRAHFDRPADHFRLYPPGQKCVKRGTLLPQGERIRVKRTFDGSSGPKCLELFEREVRERRGLEGRLHVALGMNKMRSLSSARNESLARRAAQCYQDRVPTKVISFMWDGVWQESHEVEGARVWRDTTYDRVHKFYKQLKQRDAVRAEGFRSAAEARRGHMVPYREIRDLIKNSEATKALVAEARGLKGRDVYVIFFDDDMKELGDFLPVCDEHYAAKADQGESLHVYSGGYIVSAPDNPFLELGVLADLTVRHATGRHLPDGVYYPEPGAAMLVPRDQATLPEDCSDPRQPNYESPKEMPRYVEAAKKTRGLDPKKHMVFDKRGAVTTAVPVRMQREFMGAHTATGLILWSLDNFTTMRGINQSHYHSNKWAKNVVDGLDVRARVNIGGYRLCDQGVFNRVMVSLLSRLFAHFDPVEIAQTYAQEQQVSFQVALIHVLKHYASFVEDESIPPYVGREQHTCRKRSRDRLKESRKVDAINALWERVDSCSSVTELINVMKPLLHVDRTADIHLAARDSGADVAQLFEGKLCLDRKKQVATVISKHFGVEEAAVEAGMPAAYTVIVNGGPRGGMIREFGRLAASVDPEQFYHITPLHMAALAGNMPVFKRFAKRRQYEDDMRAGAVFGCALIYCKHSGFNWDLVGRAYHPEVESKLEELMDAARLSSSEQVQVVAYLHRKKLLHNLEYDQTLFINAIKAGEEDLAMALHEIEGGWMTPDHLYTAILEEAPYTDARLMSWGRELDVDFGDIRAELGETSQLIWDVETGVYDGEPDYAYEEWAGEMEYWHNLILESAPAVDAKTLVSAVYDHDVDLTSIARELDLDELVRFKAVIRAALPKECWLD